ncbi:MAG: acyl-CoA dehydrogenase family protein [Planctomycetota bacterium]
MITPYSFQPYLQYPSGESWLSSIESRIFEKITQGQSNSESIRALLEKVSGTWRILADQSAKFEPRLVSYNAYNQRVDLVEMPAQTLQILQEVYGLHPFSKSHPFWFRYLLNYILSKNGESGVCCSLACTDGMVQVLNEFSQGANQKILSFLEEGKEGGYVHGAQFITEIQGGSDVGRNQLLARPTKDDSFQLFGEKWFCSNIIADYFLVTARPEGNPEGPKGIALFLVPAYREKGNRNGYQIHRLKNKLGTRNLPTAEVCFEGAIAYPVGPLDKGLSTIIRVVVTCSRIHSALTSAGFLQRAIADATRYCQFREVFGKPVSAYPLAAKELKEIQHIADRQIAGTLDLIEQKYLRLKETSAQERLSWRIFVMLNKMAVTRESADGIHRAIQLYAGNGIEHEFSPTPRLFNDAVINEVWEGPHHLLISNAFEDLKTSKISAKQFLSYLQITNTELIHDLQECLNPSENGFQLDQSLCEFELLAFRIIHTFQENALSRLG